MCHTCGALLVSLYSIKRHILDLHKVQKCPICDETFNLNRDKNKHLREQHGMEEIGNGRNRNLRKFTKFSCTICNKEFPSSTSLRRHNGYKHKLVKCPDCDDMYTVRSMPRHRHKAHGTEIPTCGICDYKHPCLTGVIQHQRKVHLKEKNVSCPHCELKFFNNSVLRKHMVKHGTTKKYECSFCHKKFPRQTTMRMHERIHTGEKNKVCAICGDRFVQKASLNYHMAKHHPDAC